MYELRDHLLIEEEVFQGSTIYTVDNFYKNPEEVERYLFHNEVPLHKINEKPTYNNIHFQDRRLFELNNELVHVIDLLSSICNQKPIFYHTITNQTKFYKHRFNDYENNYWWPHRDPGYNAIVYFNDESGTNFYKEINPKMRMNEHFKPWRSKKDLMLEKTLDPKYNRLVFFDGKKFLHGMDINSDRYFFDEYRKNQVFFFQ
tara:strand:- start:77 stop:682 length:606 start_codon:yes stop_codon:yes gene_type:complete